MGKNEINIEAEENKILFLKEIFKIMKSEDNCVSSLFNYIKKFYCYNEYSNLLYFTFYLITYFNTYRNNQKICSCIFFYDVINNLNEKVEFEKIIALYFKKAFRCNLSYKNEITTSFLIQVLNMILGRRNGIYTYFMQISKDLKIKFIFFMQKFNNRFNYLMNKNKDKKLFTSLDDISNYTNGIGIKVMEIKKTLITLIIMFLIESKGSININNIILLFHIKTEVKSYRKLFTNKVLTILNEEISQKLKVIISSFKLSNNSEFSDELFSKMKGSETNSFFKFLENDFSLNFSKNEHLNNFYGLLKMNKTELQFISFIINKNKHTKYILEILKGNTKIKILTKYTPLLELFKTTILNQFIIFQIFQLVYYFNNIKENNLLIKVSRVYLIISMYYSLKYPDKETLFMNEIIDVFYYNLKNGEFNIDYIELFFSFGDLSYTKDNKKKILDEIQDKIKISSYILFEKVLNLNKRKQNFLNSKNPLNNFSNFLMSSNYIEFSSFNINLIEILNTNLLFKSTVNLFKKERKEIKRETVIILANIESLIDLKKLFSKEEKNILLFNLNKKVNINILSTFIDKNNYETINTYQDGDNTISKITDQSEYSIDDISNISQISNISSNNSIINENKDSTLNKFNLITYENYDEDYEENINDDFREKILQTITAYENEAVENITNENLDLIEQPEPILLVNDSIDPPSNKIIDLEDKAINKIEKTIYSKQRAELSYMDKKKKYISIKILTSVLYSRLLINKENMFKTIKGFYNNISNKIETTQMIEIKSPIKNTKIKSSKISDLRKLKLISNNLELNFQNKILNKNIDRNKLNI